MSDNMKRISGWYHVGDTVMANMMVDVRDETGNVVKIERQEVKGVIVALDGDYIMMQTDDNDIHPYIHKDMVRHYYPSVVKKRHSGE